MRNKLFINDQWAAGKSGEMFDVPDPSDRKIIRQITTYDRLAPRGWYRKG